MPQMTDAEMRRADRLMRGDSMTPVAIWRLLKKSREVAAKSAPKGQKRKASKLSSTTVYAFCNGETHPRQRVETRGLTSKKNQKENSHQNSASTR